MLKMEKVKAKLVSPATLTIPVYQQLPPTIPGAHGNLPNKTKTISISSLTNSNSSSSMNFDVEKSEIVNVKVFKSPEIPFGLKRLERNPRDILEKKIGMTGKNAKSDSKCNVFPGLPNVEKHFQKNICTFVVRNKRFQENLFGKVLKISRKRS